MKTVKFFVSEFVYDQVISEIDKHLIYLRKLYQSEHCVDVDVHDFCVLENYKERFKNNRSICDHVLDGDRFYIMVIDKRDVSLFVKLSVNFSTLEDQIDFVSELCKSLAFE